MTPLAGLPLWRAPAQAVGPYLRLGKLRIASLSTLSAGAAYCLAAPQLTGRIFSPLAGLFLLACGAGALNQFQERALDARMPRTRGRPLPAGELRPRAALLFAVCLLPPGFLLLQRGGGTPAALLGLAALVLYNGVYTGLKKRTAFALFPGALVGAIPPAIGWASAGGGLADPRLLALCGLLFLWQIPHSGLLLLAHGEEYTRAGLPVVSALLPRREFARIVQFWVLGAAAAGMLLPLPEAAAAFRTLLAAAALALAASSRGIRSGAKAAAHRAFRTINAFMALVLILAVVAAARHPSAAGLDNRAIQRNIVLNAFAIAGLEGPDVSCIHPDIPRSRLRHLLPGVTRDTEMASLTTNRRLFP